ncbi:hypothetical protein FQN53_001103 [Emmonsiellopsis sp. PD_33]|nr:hypothetical protein FQN53_001103 [Emmonsiellopsis sp. PD_33]
MVRTRIVCVSDTHGYGTQDGAFKLPKGDVLIHAGDLSNQGSSSELRKAVEWIENADFEAKIVIAGNHDITLDSDFYHKNWESFHNQAQESTDECKNLFSNSSSITYLNHESATIRLSNPEGPRTVFKIFGSPYSPYCGKWAFLYSPEEAPAFWSQIPADTDIVLTHTPPHSHRDKNEHGNLGCEYLRQALWRIRPRLAVCGHVHDGRGYDRVRWDLEPQSEFFKELSSTTGELPPRGSKKQSLVDLTGRVRPRLDNDGSLNSPSSIPTANDAPIQDTARELGESIGSSGRNETCIVNAAIMATNWPHRGGKKFNTPLVVDLDLPTYEA